MPDKRIIIAGAGISGLIAAVELEQNGYAPLIIEKKPRVGGRVKTDLHDGVPLDHGFQVLLSAYPAAQKYLDYEALDMVPFLPGASIHIKHKHSRFGDPLRDSSFTWSTLFSFAGSLGDKVRVYGLREALKKRSLEEIFAADEMTTLDYLQKFGFSETIIERFFRPFFGGIFLEKELSTSSRMFEFTFKMFSEGTALWPKKGIGAIAEQLKEKLKQTEIITGQSVERVGDHTLTTDEGKQYAFDALIWAHSSPLSGNAVTAVQNWNNCYNLYFKVHHTPEPPIIHLIGEEGSYLNNYHYLNDLLPENEHASILSATVVDSKGYEGETLVDLVQQDLSTYAGIEDADFIQMYDIPKALPVLESLQNEPDPSKVSVEPGVFVCGDHLANPSLNAAMQSGAIAAHQCVQFLAASKV